MTSCADEDPRRQPGIDLAEISIVRFFRRPGEIARARRLRTRDRLRASHRILPGELRQGGWINEKRFGGGRFQDRSWRAASTVACAWMKSNPRDGGITMESRRRTILLISPASGFSPNACPSVPLVALFETAFYQWAPEAPCVTRCRRGGSRRASAAGAFTAPATNSSPNAPPKCSAARTWPIAPGNFMLTAAKASRARAGLARYFLSFGRQFVHHRHSQRRRHRQQHGLSPQSGLPHNNRVGDLDAFALPFMMRSTGLTLDEAEAQLCKESGLKGLSGGQRHSGRRSAGRAGKHARPIGVGRFRSQRAALDWRVLFATQWR
jgi:hypothetical protein